MRYAREQRVPARRCGILGEELRERPVRSPEHAFLVERGPYLGERMTGDPGAYGVPERFACPEPVALVFQVDAEAALDRRERIGEAGRLPERAELTGREDADHHMAAVRRPEVVAERAEDVVAVTGPLVAVHLGFRERSAERRVGKKCVSRCRSRWGPEP